MLVGVGLLFTACSCSPDVPDADSSSQEASRAKGSVSEVPAFVRHFFPDLQARLVLVHSEDTTLPLDRFRSAIDSLWLRPFFRKWVTLNVETKTDNEVTAADFAEADVLVIATAAVPVRLSFLGEDLPLSWGDDGFRFLGKDYSERLDVFIMGHPHPHSETHGLYLLMGNDADDLLDHLPIAQSRGYHLFDRGKRVVTGSWKDGAPPWTIDPDAHRDLERERTAVEATPHFRFYVHDQALDAPALQAFAADTERRYDRVAAFLGDRLVSTPPVEYYLYERFEDKGIFFGDFVTTYGIVLPDVQHVSFAQHEVHRALGDELDADDWPREVLLLMRAALGRPSAAFLEIGLGLYFSEGWQQEGYAYWAARLVQADQVPPLAELLDDERETYLSPFIVEALAGSFVDYLLQTRGKESFLKQYADGILSSEEQQTLERGWHAFLNGLAERYRSVIEAQRAAFPAPAAFQKGFNYAPNPGSHGYLTRSSDASLARLHGLGVNAVALVPYASTPHDKPTVLLPERRINGENDEAMVHAILDARRLGLTVMLKPQLSVPGWTGDLDMTSAADWDRFFFYYERWISHYAFLAELYGVEILCVGTELVQAALQHEARWTRLVGKLRRLYSGKLVYASNWGSEFETLTFWDHFDYIGLDNYYPLSDKDDPTDEELRQTAETVAQKIEALSARFNKPILMTEIGFPGSVAPWKRPYQQKDSAPEENGQAQARGYEAWFRALHGKPWLAGLYWWKWFSYDPAVNRSADYVPQRKVTERVIEQWYGQAW